MTTEQKNKKNNQKTSEANEGNLVGQAKKKGGKVLKGTVVSTKMKDTVVVKVSSYEKHPKYGKFISSQKKFKAHSPENTLKEGDIVEIKECRPISKDKHFIVIK